MNVWGIATWAKSLLTSSTAGKVITIVIIIPTCIAAVVLLVYLLVSKAPTMANEFAEETRILSGSDEAEVMEEEDTL